MSKKEPKLVRWYETYCECGQKFYWSRTQEKDINLLAINGGDEVPLCEECESYKKGYDDGKKASVEGKKSYKKGFEEGFAACLAQVNKKLKKVESKGVAWDS